MTHNDLVIQSYRLYRIQNGIRFSIVQTALDFGMTEKEVCDILGFPEDIIHTLAGHRKS